VSSETTWKEHALRLEQMTLHNGILRDVFVAFLSEVHSVVVAQAFSQPKVFFSYAWPCFKDEEWTIDFIKTLAEDLGKVGIDVLLDRNRSRFGYNTEVYMREGIEQSTHVILFGTNSLLHKYQNTGGTASICTELSLIEKKRRQEAQGSASQEKNSFIIPVILSGRINTALPPDYERYTAIEDFSSNGEFQEGRKSYFLLLKELINHLYQKRRSNLILDPIWHNFEKNVFTLCGGFSIERGLTRANIESFLPQEKATKEQEAQLQETQGSVLLQELIQNSKSSPSLNQTGQSVSVVSSLGTSLSSSSSSSNAPLIASSMTSSVIEEAGQLQETIKRSIDEDRLEAARRLQQEAVNRGERPISSVPGIFSSSSSNLGGGSIAIARNQTTLLSQRLPAASSTTTSSSIKGLRHVQLQGNHTLYRALSLSLYGNEDLSRLRLDIGNTMENQTGYLEQQKKIGCPDVEWPLAPNQTMEDFVKCLKENSPLALDFGVGALNRYSLLGNNWIFVIGPDSRIKDLSNIMLGSQPRINPIFVYENQGHYDALLLESGANARAILAHLIQTQAPCNSPRDRFYDSVRFLLGQNSPSQSSQQSSGLNVYNHGAVAIASTALSSVPINIRKGGQFNVHSGATFFQRQIGSTTIHPHGELNVQGTVMNSGPIDVLGGTANVLAGGEFHNQGTINIGTSEEQHHSSSNISSTPN